MAIKTPVKATFTGSDVTGLAEYQAADFIGVVDGGTGAVTFSAGILTADGTNAFTTVTAPSGTIVGTSDTQTLTNKTINSASNTITITESNISDLGSYITSSSTDTLTNKTIDSASNTLTLDLGEGTLTGTTAEFNTALQDGSFATLAGTETLTNKTINASQLVDGSVSNAKLANSSISVVDDSSTSSTISLGETLKIAGGTGITSTISGDTVTLAVDGTIVTESSTDTLTNKTIDSASNTLTLDLGEGTLTGT